MGVRVFVMSPDREKPSGITRRGQVVTRLHRDLPACSVFQILPLDSRTSSRPHAITMKTALGLLLFFSLACHTASLKCHTCVASSEDECNRQGSSPCPQYADACSTITGQNTVMKSCSYKAFCEKAHHGNAGAKMECCFSEDCNGPHRGHSHGENNAAGALSCSPALLLGALMVRTAIGRL
ncbi:uncharacterized protein FYW47_007287 [Aplochiton taeniatus]